MMKAFMDDVRYDQGGRRVRMTLRNRNAAPNGLRAEDWNDLQQTFGPTDASFDVETEEVQRTSEVSDPFAAHQVELHAFLDPLLASMSEDDVSNEDKREHTRHAFTGQCFTEETGVPPRPAYARNISHGGLCFLCKAPFESRLITVDLVLNGERVRIESEVVRCTELIPNVYDVGVRFLRSAE